MSGNTELIWIFDIPLIVFPDVVMFQARILVCRRIKFMTGLIKPPVANIESPDKGLFFIDNDYFSMMRPQDR